MLFLVDIAYNFYEHCPQASILYVKENTKYLACVLCVVKWYKAVNSFFYNLALKWQNQSHSKKPQATRLRQVLLKAYIEC